MSASGSPTDPIDYILVDTAFLVVNKPAGLLSVPGRQQPDCLEARVRNDFPDALTVHRLDMATSGVCVLARGKPALAHLQQQFERRRTKKRYIAMVAGCVTQDLGTVDQPLRCDWPNRPLQMICPKEGRPALTHWQVLSRETDVTRLALTPVTGRSHQLRVHMTHIGHPILGDPWYGTPASQTAASRLLLHAEGLGFYHPITDEFILVEASAPF